MLSRGLKIGLAVAVVLYLMTQTLQMALVGLAVAWLADMLF